MMKKLLAWMLCMVICVICVIPVHANDYPVLSDWAKEEAYLAEANGLFLHGGELHSDLRCAASRAQAVRYVMQLVETLLGHELASTASCVFPDLSNSSTNKIADKAYTAGIVNGEADGNFHEDDWVTREQYAVMLDRSITYMEQERNTSVRTQAQSTIPYKDAGNISPWAREAVDALAALGIMQGTAQNKFEPQQQISFEQMLVLSYRCFSLFQT